MAKDRFPDPSCADLDGGPLRHECNTLADYQPALILRSRGRGVLLTVGAVQIWFVRLRSRRYPCVFSFVDRLMIHIDHELASVVRVADELLPLGIDDKVEQLQRDEADQDRAVVGDLGNTHFAVTILDRQFHRLEDAEGEEPATVLA